MEVVLRVLVIDLAAQGERTGVVLLEFVADVPR
jgi:hypothetical protein